MLFVDAAIRGKGTGKFLLNYAVEQLQADELDVNEQNPQGVGFYRHMGFTQTGRSELDGEGKSVPAAAHEIHRQNSGIMSQPKTPVER